MSENKELTEKQKELVEKQKKINRLKKKSPEELQAILEAEQKQLMLIRAAIKAKEDVINAKKRKERTSACVKKGSILLKRDLLDVPDAVILGLLMSAEKSLKDPESEYYKNWYKIGAAEYAKTNKKKLENSASIQLQRVDNNETLKTSNEVVNG